MLLSPPPILLIHGIDDTAQVFHRMIAYLRDRGWSDIHTINLVPNNGDQGLEILAEQVRAYVETQMTDAPMIDLVGFSMGGIVSRYYVQRLGGAGRVRRFITLSSPHYGTCLAYLRHNPGARQMRPRSAFLQDLNATVAVDFASIECLSLWTPYDLMIVPAHSSRLPIGRMDTLPVLAHPWMLTDPRSLATVAAALQPSGLEIEARR